MHTSSLQPPPPQVNPSWLCYPVLMSVRSPLLPCSALFLTASQTHAVTQPHSACLLAASLLGPSAFFLLHSASRAQLTSRQPMGGRHAARQTARQDTPPQHVSLNTAKCNMASRRQPRQLTWSPLLCAAAPTDQTSFTSLSVSVISPHVSILAHQHWPVSHQGWCRGEVRV